MYFNNLYLLKVKMPYSLEKVGTDKYYVITTLTGHRHSNHPLSKEQARKQLFVLHKIYNETEN